MAMKRKILGMMGKMEVLIREVGSVGVIELAGEIDIYNCSEIRKLIDAFIKRKIVRIIVDMAKVTYIDSSTISVFLSEKKRLAALNGGLALLNLKGSPRAVLESAKLLDIFDTFDKEADALKALGG